MYVRTYIHTYIALCCSMIHMFIWLHTYARLYAIGLPCVCTVRMAICAYILVYMYVCVYVCMYVCKYTYGAFICIM